MTDEQIIQDWFDDKDNTDRLFTIAYSEPVYNFIESTASMLENKYGRFYNVFGNWQRIVIRNKSTETQPQ